MRTTKRQIWIEVEFAENGIIVFTDWTRWINSASRGTRGEFTKVPGKTIDYYIKGFLDYERAKSFAIWWHINKNSGIVRKHRLD